MRFHSTNRRAKHFALPAVLIKGLAPDGGLFMPDFWPRLPGRFFGRLEDLDFQQIAAAVLGEFFGRMPKRDLAKLSRGAFNFPVPLRQIDDGLFVLELFHGPTMAFKDFGARFLARSLGYFLRRQKRALNIIVATSGDTGSAVASGFFGVPGIRVFILYPSGKVSPLQEKQLTTFGRNITALEVKGTFDDCQKLAKRVLADKSLNRQRQFSSANSINFGRLLPQSLYYFWAAAGLKKRGIGRPPVFVVPSGNFGNLFAGLMAKKMGLPVGRFIAATNANNIVPKYLRTGKFLPKKSKQTISNAMDVGNPSNFTRMLELYGGSRKKMAVDLAGYSATDRETKKTIAEVYAGRGYVCDPHTAVGLAAARRYRAAAKDRGAIVVLATAHPAKFREIVQPVIGRRLAVPRQLRAAMKKRKRSLVIANDYQQLTAALLKG